MFHQIRSLLQASPGQLSDKVEVDETYIGGKLTGKRGKQLANKTTVFGMAQRQGIVKAFKVSDMKQSTVLPLIKQNIISNTLIYTDEYQGHRDLWDAGYRHKYITHSKKQYVDGDIHTNTIEGFFGQLKRSISGTYHVVSPKYLQLYVDEFSFRYNYQHAFVFSSLLKKMVNKDL